MSIAESFLTEFENQAPITRRYLERLPSDKLTWKPHPKSMSAGQLALHIALVPAGIVHFVLNNPADAPKSFEFPEPKSVYEVLSKYDQGVAEARIGLLKFDDHAMEETWRMVMHGREILAQPRKDFLRDVMFSHIYQHRGQFSVYLRMLDVAVPASWGPSADELPPFMRIAQAA